MHKDKRAERITGTGPEGKAVVASVLQRGGKVRAKVISTRRKPELQAMVRVHVEAGSSLYSDALKSYEGLEKDFTHQLTDHTEAYVNGQVHANNCENFLSRLKRGINGTYISVESFHLFRYVDEQASRYSNRHRMSDKDRFSYLVRKTVGKRLTYAELTAKVGQKKDAIDVVLSRGFDLSLGTALSRVRICTFLVLGFSMLYLFARDG